LSAASGGTGLGKQDPTTAPIHSTELLDHYVDQDPMRPKIKVLVFPCGSEIGLELCRSLKNLKEIELYGGSSEPDHGHYVYSRYLGGLPFVGDPDFVDRINAAVRQYGIDYVFPAHDSVVLSLATAQDNGLLACPVLTSPASTCRTCRSKKATMDTFQPLLRTPALYETLGEVVRWPVFLKPDVGQGSKGTYTAMNAEACRILCDRDPSLLVMEYLPGPEFTVDCFTNRHGALVFAQPRSRLRVTNGISVRTAPVERADLTAMAHHINQRLALRGVWFFQAKETAQGQPALMEIAPRVAGAMGLCRGAGVNLPLMSVYDAEGCEVQATINPKVREMDRALYNRFHLDYAYEHVYVDLDDCLISDGKVNTELISFLYQCVNRRVALHLLTRHARDPQETLRQHRLGGLFDDIIHLKDGQTKSSVIVQRSAVFIDDSFAERTDVNRTLGIPVFGPDAVEALLASD
jgi:hypothetical protein